MSSDSNKILSHYNEKKLHLKENKKRIYFVLKCVLFLILSYFYFYYIDWLKEHHIKIIYLKALLFYIAANLLISTLRLSLVYIYIKRRRLQNDYKDNFILGVNQIASLLSVIILIASILYLFKINPIQLFTSLSIVAAALALLFKDYIANAINGLIIMFSDQFSLNEYIQIGEHRGRIVDINLLHLQLRNDEEDVIYIPNNLVFSKDVISYTKGNSSMMWVEFELDPFFTDKLELLENELLEQLNKNFTNHIRPSSIYIHIVKIQKDHIKVRMNIALINRNTRLEKLIRNSCNQIIVSFLGKNKINYNSI